MLTPKQTEKQKVIFRFVPKALERLFLFEWLVIRPTEIFLASHIGMHDAVEELRFKLFPSTTDQPFTSSTLSKALKRDTRKYLGHSFGIKEYRDFQTTFTRYHPDPHPPPPSATKDSVADSQRGHATATALTHYGTEEGLPQGIPPSKILGYEMASNWWNHITGMIHSSQTSFNLSNTSLRPRSTGKRLRVPNPTGASEQFCPSGGLHHRSRCGHNQGLLSRNDLKPSRRDQHRIFDNPNGQHRRDESLCVPSPEGQPAPLTPEEPPRVFIQPEGLLQDSRTS